MTRLNNLGKFLRLLPYAMFAVVGALIFLIYSLTTGDLKDLSLNLFSNTAFFFMAFIFFDIVRTLIQNRESKYLAGYIKNRISNDIFVALYFQKKIIHGYNLDTNTLGNIMGILNYSKEEIRHAVTNQRYLGFQIFKDTDEVRSLFDEALNNNLILKYSSHLETINLLRIANNLSLLEAILKTEDNFKPTHLKSSEFTILNGKDMNPDNPDKFILLRKTPHQDRYVVYDSGVFEKRHLNNIFDEYIFKEEVANRIAKLLYDTFSLMKMWVPEVVRLRKNEGRFRIIKEYFSDATKVKSGDSEMYVADIIQPKREAAN